MKELEEILGYNFTNKNLLLRAITHSSFDAKNNYERLEFLGDKILGLIITAELFVRFPDEDQGKLSKRRSSLVSGVTLAAMAKNLGVGDFIKLSSNEIRDNGREKQNTLEDCAEALIGAMYVDSGYDLQVCKDFILRNWEEVINQMPKPPKDPKSQLQEYTQGNNMGLPQYEVTEVKGESHNPSFTIKVSVENIGEFEATASSKKTAQSLAAAQMLEFLGLS